MTQPVIDIVIPTIRGREHYVERCVELYHQNSSYDVNVWVWHDAPTVGSAWIDGVRWYDQQYAGDTLKFPKVSRDSRYLHLSCDDLEPQPRWDEFAVEVADSHMQPCPLQLRADGTPFQWGRSQVEVGSWTPTNATTLPFMPWSLWDMITQFDTYNVFTSTLRQLHYYSDDWISWCAQRFGWKDVFHSGYAFVHHLALEGRGAGMSDVARMEHDAPIYESGIQEWQRIYGIGDVDLDEGKCAG